MKPLITVGAFFKIGSHLLDENKKSLLIHYLTEFLLGSIGVGDFIVVNSGNATTSFNAWGMDLS